MKYIKYFKESVDNISLKDKLESIVSMYEYLWQEGIDPDSLNNFTGNCSVLFVGCTKCKRKKDGRPYEFDIECLLKKLDNDYRKEEKLQKIEELYKLSLVSKFRHTKEEIEQFLSSVLNMKVTGAKVIKSSKIEQYINGWTKKPCFSIKCRIDDEFLPMDEVDVRGKNRKELEELEDEFYSYYRLIYTRLSELNPREIGYTFSMNNNSHNLDFYNFYIRLEQI